MGRVTILHSRVNMAANEVIEWDGNLLDFLDHRFPEGLSNEWGAPRIVDARRGEFIATECQCRYCQPKTRLHRWMKKRPAHCKVNAFLKPVDDIAIDMGRSPAGVDPITVALIVVAVVVSVAISFLLIPKIPGQSNQEAGSVYSVTARANQAKLGGIIPVQYGQYTRVPEYASQSYRVFADNEEIRYFLLSLGAGDYQLDELYIGNTPVSDFPSGIIDYEIYTQVDHLDTLGTIETDFGIHENVVTSGEVDQIELEALSEFSQLLSVSATSGGSTLTIDSLSDFADSGVQASDDMVIEDTAIAGTYTVATVSATEVTIEETFPATVTTTDANISFKSTGSVTRGPFVVNRAGTETQEIEIDIEWPRGIYKQNDEGEFKNLTIDIRATVQEIDDDGADVGSPTTHDFSITGATATPQRRTYSIAKAAGRYKVSVARTDEQDIKPRDADTTVWTGLKAYLDYDSGLDVYGYTTILAVKITGAQQVSDSSKQQIRAQTTRIINQLGTTTPVAGGNLADVFADIITDDNYGAAGSTDEYDATALGAFRTAQSSRSGFNGVFDQSSTVWEALSAVAALGRAKPYPKGLALSLVVDEVKASRSSLVTPDNMLPNSFKAQYEFIEPGSYDGMEVEYRDASTGDPLYTRYPTAALNPERLKVIGLTDEDEADSMAEYLWKQKTLRNLSLEWSMEYDARNFTPFQRVGVALPIFGAGDYASVRSSSGTTVVLSRPAPSGTLSVLFRDQNGDSSAVVSATGDGSTTIELAASPPFTLVSDGSAVPTLCGFALTSDFTVIDALITSISINGNTSRVQAVNYSSDLFTGLA